MSTADETTDPRDHPAVRAHVLVCLGALVAVLAVLLFRRFGPWSLFPVLVGALGVAQRWRTAPLLFLASLAGFISIQTVLATGRTRFDPIPTFRLFDWVLGAAVLAYVAAHYRLQSLLTYIFPPDPRRREDGPARSFLFWQRRPPMVQHRRPPELVSSWETSWLVLCLPLWATLAQVGWLLLPTSLGPLELSPRNSRALFLIWFVGVGLFVTAGLLSYAEQRRATRAEAELHLQDTFWRETSRDQRRIHRWLVWARFRRRRKGTP